MWLSLSGARELRRASAHSYWELARRAEAAVPHEILRQVEAHAEPEVWTRIQIRHRAESDLP